MEIPVLDRVVSFIPIRINDSVGLPLLGHLYPSLLEAPYARVRPLLRFAISSIIYHANFLIILLPLFIYSISNG